MNLLIKKTNLGFIELLDERKINHLNPLTYKDGFKIIENNKEIQN